MEQPRREEPQLSLARQCSSLTMIPRSFGELEIRCEHLGFRVTTAGDGLRTLLKVTKEKPDLLILDLKLPDVDGFRVCERLTDPKFPALPVIILTGNSDEATVARCKSLGAFYVFKGPRTWEELEPLIFRIFADGKSQLTETAPSTNHVRVLIVDDDAVSLKSISTGLQRYGIEAFTAANGMQGFWLALKERPDVIFTDYHMANGDGRYLLGRIKSTPSTQRIPVVVFSARALSEGERSAVSRDLQGRGQAAGFLTKPISVSAFLKELRHHVSLPERADNPAFIELDYGR